MSAGSSLGGCHRAPACLPLPLAAGPARLPDWGLGGGAGLALPLAARSAVLGGIMMYRYMYGIGVRREFIQLSALTNQ